MCFDEDAIRQRCDRQLHHSSCVTGDEETQLLWGSPAQLLWDSPAQLQLDVITLRGTVCKRGKKSHKMCESEKFLASLQGMWAAITGRGAAPQATPASTKLGRIFLWATEPCLTWEFSLWTKWVPQGTNLVGSELGERRRGKMRGELDSWKIRKEGKGEIMYKSVHMYNWEDLFAVWGEDE